MCQNTLNRTGGNAFRYFIRLSLPFKAHSLSIEIFEVRGSTPGLLKGFLGQIWSSVRGQSREAQEVRAGQRCVVRSGPVGTHTYRLMPVDAAKRGHSARPDANAKEALCTRELERSRAGCDAVGVAEQHCTATTTAKPKKEQKGTERIPLRTKRQGHASQPYWKREQTTMPSKGINAG